MNHSFLARLSNPLGFVVCCTVLVVVLALGERGLKGGAAEGPPARGAHWIWVDRTFEAEEPIAFVAFKEFELEEAPGRARLALIADESYSAYLNGEYIGAETYRPEWALREYEVGGFLTPGTNRLVVILRSRRGPGGFLAHLRAGNEAVPLVVTDLSWRLFTREDPALWRLGETPQGGEVPRALGQAIAGRWRLPETTQHMPIPLRGRGPAQRTDAVQVRALGGDHWIPLKNRRRQPSVGPLRLYDFGKRVTGFLHFPLSGSEEASALAWYGNTPPDPMARPADAVFLFLPGQRHYRDLHPRSFRYVLLVGVEPAARPQVREVGPALAERLAPPPLATGVLGIRPPVATSRAEELVWRRLRRKEQGTL